MRDKLVDDLSKHRNILPRLPAEALLESLPTSMSPTYNILNFNYTTIIDRLISSPRPSILGRHIHVHGTFSRGMIMGVDNIGQVANRKVFSDPGQQRMLLKPLLNQQFDQDNDEAAHTCINDSDEICVFGMSLGETDLTWWRRIGDWLQMDGNHQLLIFSRGSGMAPLYPYDTIIHQEKLRDRFCTLAKVEDEAQNRVHIIITDRLFNLSPVFKSPSGAAKPALV